VLKKTSFITSTPIVHSLLDNGQPTRLAEDQGTPLAYDDGDEEGGMARVLQSLPAAVSPILMNKRKILVVS